MATSYIGKKSDNPTKKQVDRVIDAAAQYISSWTQKEFNKLSNNKDIPLIWPLPNGGYIIGKKRIILIQGYWQLQNSHGEYEHEFESKQSAIFYCLCDYVQSSSLARTIRTHDSHVLKLKNDIVHYENSLRKAIKNQDSFVCTLWDSRLNEARLRLADEQQMLEKAVKSAKKLRVWDK